MGGVELVDGAADPVGEVVHSAAELVAVRRGLHFVLSVATCAAASNTSSLTMRGQSIGIHLSGSRGTWRLRPVGCRSGTDSVRLK